MPNPNRNKGNPPYTPSPTLADLPVPSGVVWPSSEARDTVVQTNQDAYARHVNSARSHLEESARLNADLGQANHDLKELTDRITRLTEEKARQDHYAGQEKTTADGYAAVLHVLGVTVSEDMLVHPLNTGQGDPATHAAVFGDPRLGGAFLDEPPHGYCVYCQQPAWRTAHTEAAPHGARHQAYTACDPGNPNTQFARLSDELQAAARPIS